MVLPGVLVAEPDVRREDLLEIVIWADLEADVGTLGGSIFFPSDVRCFFSLKLR